MKPYLLFCAFFNFFALCLTEEESPEQYTPYYKECSAVVQHYDLDNLKRRFSKKTFQETDDYNTKCFFRCILTEAKLMNDDGSWNYKVIYSGFATQELVPIALKECLKDNVKDPCEKAYLFDKCTAAYEIQPEGR